MTRQSPRNIPELMHELSSALTDLSNKMGTLSEILSKENPTPEEMDIANRTHSALNEIMTRVKKE